MGRETKCFVIMPFSQTTSEHTERYWTGLYDGFLKPLIEENPCIEVSRSSPRREDILGEIIKNLLTKDIVVADLTDHNSNVFWELGVRQSFQHRTITIAEQGTWLPFDVGRKGTLFYGNKDVVMDERFHNDFKSTLQDCIDNPGRPDSIVLESIGGRGSLFEVIRKDEVHRRIAALKSELDFNIGLLPRIMADVRSNDALRKTAMTREGIMSSSSLPVSKVQTNRFRYAAIELVIVNRYLEADSDFYRSAELYYDTLQVLNDQLRVLEATPARTEAHLINTEKAYTTAFENFQKQLKPFLE